MQLPYSRRFFLKTSTLASLGVATGGCKGLFSKEEVRFAVVGLRIRGRNHIEEFIRLAFPEPPEEGSEATPPPPPPARLVAICDVDSAILEETAAAIEKDTGSKVETYGDYRKLLEQDHIDAVVLATPNHLHALQTIWAFEAGKDVYVEKPVCHTLWEGRQMLEASIYHRRIVQSGFQNRSDVGLLAAFPRILAGELGPIQHIRGLCYRKRDSIGRADSPITPPATVDYDQWLGPAEDLPILRPQFHYDWHWVWNTGNGDLGNQGPHELDLIRWILGDPDHPSAVMTIGGRFGWDDAGETPNMQLVRYSWNQIPVDFEVRNLVLEPGTDAMPHFDQTRVGVIITCEGGRFQGGRGGGFFIDNEGQRMEAFKGDGGGDHLSSFFRAVQNRRKSELRSSLKDGYRSSALVHLANSCLRTGQSCGDTEVRATVADDPWLSEAYARYVNHLKAWNLDPSELKWNLGLDRQFDAASEQFTGDDAVQANKLLRREGRVPYQIPEYQ
jgi:predicted dehydrogenase